MNTQILPSIVALSLQLVLVFILTCKVYLHHILVREYTQHTPFCIETKNRRKHSQNRARWIPCRQFCSSFLVANSQRESFRYHQQAPAYIVKLPYRLALLQCSHLVNFIGNLNEASFLECSLCNVFHINWVNALNSKLDGTRNGITTLRWLSTSRNSGFEEMGNKVQCNTAEKWDIKV